MQSDWHRYNLKRRVASLPPLTSEIFAEKVLANQASAAATAAKAQFEKTCAACSRTYFSENAYTNHLHSQKHKLRLVELSRGPDLETEDGTESIASSAFSLGESVATTTKASDIDGEVAHAADGLQQANLHDPESTADAPVTSTPTSETSTYPAEPTLACLFCNLTSTSVTDNITHMSRQHGLFIPEQTYLVDLPGLLSYLHERVHVLHECLYCGQIKYTASGIQTHMRDKGHCMIAFESEDEMVEVGQFYDFRSSYSDDEDDESESDIPDTDAKSSQKPKLGAQRATTYENADSEDSDWEEEEEEDSDTTTSNTSNPTKSTKRSDRAPTTPHNQSYSTPTELHLPSGRTAGHRSLSRYYRQNLHSYPSALERAQAQKLIEDGSAVPSTTSDPSLNMRAQIRNATGQQVAIRGRGKEVVTRAGGGLGLIGASEEQRKEAARLEFKERRRAERRENRYRAGNERANNNQKHFRDPLLQ